MINNVLALAPVKTVVDLYSRLETKVLLYSSEIMRESLYVPHKKEHHYGSVLFICCAVVGAILSFYMGYRIENNKKEDYTYRSTISVIFYIQELWNLYV